MHAGGPSQPEERDERLTVRFEGRVQGVGFRFAVCRAAASLPVSGFVRNEYDGSVLMVAEGSGDALRDLLRAVRRSPVGRHIVREHPRWEAARGEFRGFDIAY